MNVVFDYEREKDVWCLLNKGRSSNNSQLATRVYQQLVEEYGADPTNESTRAFIEDYLYRNNIDIKKRVSEYQEEWNIIADEYKERAESVFGVFLLNDVTGYLTINNRCPYSVEENFFFVAVPTVSVRKTTMHELWHFYTWRKFGAATEARLGKEAYNDIKEALTVLLNVECLDLLPEGVTDIGYPQHKELREEILKIWAEGKDMEKLWDRATEFWGDRKLM